MIRIVIENLLLFLAPTAIYLGYMYLTRKGSASGSEILAEAPLVWLAMAGGALVVITLVAFGSTSGGRPGQGYQPPEVRDGKIVPGQIK